MSEQTIKCPHCNSELSLAEEFLGSEVQCPVCNQNFVTESAVPEIQPEVVEAAGPEGQEEPAETGNSFKDKLGNLYSKARQKYDEAQQAEKERFEESSQMELFNKVRQGGIYRKIWMLILPAVVGAACILGLIIAMSTQGRDDGLGCIWIIVLGFVSAVVYVIQTVLFSTTKSKTDKKVSEEDLASSEQIERKKLEGIFFGLTNLFQPVSNSIYQLWCNITDQDQQYLRELDILPRFGKNQSQLIADSHTLFSPVLDSFRLDENSNFLYPQENVTKLYTFEDQLIIFSAVWDYTTGNLFDESSSAFFFTEICDISTSSNYDDHSKTYYKIPENIKIKPFPLTFFLITAVIIMVVFSAITFPTVMSSIKENHGYVTNNLGPVIAAAVAACFCVSAFFISTICLVFDLNCLKRIIPLKVQKNTKVKQSETFTITARSGKSTGITIVCDEWIEANNGKFTRRTDAEKIIQAIRKMIEEKKVAADA